MEHNIILAIVGVSLVLVGSMSFGFMRREFSKKRSAYRMSQALRRGLTRPGGPWTPSPHVVDWTPCETSSPNCA